MTRDAQQGPRPAPAVPCAECPWRVSNAGRPAPEPYEDSYTLAHHMRCWTDARWKAINVCHLSGGDAERFPPGKDPRWVAAGYVAVPEGVSERECAGAVAAVMRELRLLVEAGSFAEYQRHRPLGLTAPIARLWKERLRGQVDDLPPVRMPSVDDAEIIDVPADPRVREVDVMDPRTLATVGSAAARLLAELQGEAR